MDHLVTIPTCMNINDKKNIIYINFSIYLTLTHSNL